MSLWDKWTRILCPELEYIGIIDYLWKGIQATESNFAPREINRAGRRTLPNSRAGSARSFSLPKYIPWRVLCITMKHLRHDKQKYNKQWRRGTPFPVKRSPTGAHTLFKREDHCPAEESFYMIIVFQAREAISCETQPSSFQLYLPLFVRSFVPHGNILPLYENLEHAYHIFSVRISSRHHIIDNIFAYDEIDHVNQISSVRISSWQHVMQHKRPILCVMPLKLSFAQLYIF